MSANRWEAEGRARKASAIATELLRRRVPPSEAATWPVEERLALAEACGIKPPSETTWEQALSALPGGQKMPHGSGVRKVKVRRPRTDAAATVAGFTAELDAAGIEHYWCGSWRRGAEMIGDLDLLIVTDSMLSWLPLPDDLLKPGAVTQCSVVAARGDEYPIQIDLWASKEATVGAHLWHLTGPAELNVAMRARASRMGLGSLSQFGALKDGVRLDEPGRSEVPIAEMLQIPYLEPTQRQNWRDVCSI